MERSQVKFPKKRIVDIILAASPVPAPSTNLKDAVEQMRDLWSGDRRNEDRRDPVKTSRRLGTDGVMDIGAGRRKQFRRDNPNYMPPEAFTEETPPEE